MWSRLTRIPRPSQLPPPTLAPTVGVRLWPAVAHVQIAPRCPRTARLQVPRALAYRPRRAGYGASAPSVRAHEPLQSTTSCTSLSLARVCSCGPAATLAHKVACAAILGMRTRARRACAYLSQFSTTSSISSPHIALAATTSPEIPILGASGASWMTSSAVDGHSGEHGRRRSCTRSPSSSCLGAITTRNATTSEGY
ncbi:hypothetical protein OH77DRAFT_1230381 [Trametes cingulata]|nr:hypothetical protein OH77DRAFT_1230381 [Trametes cingulata]